MNTDHGLYIRFNSNGEIAFNSFFKTEYNKEKAYWEIDNNKLKIYKKNTSAPIPYEDMVQYWDDFHVSVLDFKATPPAPDIKWLWFDFKINGGKKEGDLSDYTVVFKRRKEYQEKKKDETPGRKKIKGEL